MWFAALALAVIGGVVYITTRQRETAMKTVTSDKSTISFGAMTIKPAPEKVKVIPTGSLPSDWGFVDDLPVKRPEESFTEYLRRTTSVKGVK